MSENFKILLLRFARGAGAGAISAMIVVIPSSVHSWGDFGAWMTSLAIACCFGLVTGSLMTLDKMTRLPSEEQPK